MYVRYLLGGVDMTFLWMFLVSAVCFLVGYKVYGRFMARVYGLDDTRETPAVRLCDDVDYCPAHPGVLLGHHFSSIAGAGPITGPIAAGMAWGWLPTILWVVIGSTFVGGPHDMGALVASMRHDGKSIGEVVERWIGHTGKVLFLCFTILTLILVVAVFLAMSVGTFVGDASVAFVSTMYIVVAVIAGLLMYKARLPIWLVTVLMLAIIAVSCIYVTPETTPGLIKLFTRSANFWYWVLGIYILAASILPVWVLLQPRDYLASYFLYFAVFIGAVGMLFGSSMMAGGEEAILPLQGTIKWAGLSKVALWPMLFITVACGACSGFHALVGSGTTSKQLRRETDSILVGYGAMLIEGLVAVIAMGTLMVVGAKNSVGVNPIQIFSDGFGHFATLLGLEKTLGTRLGAIAINSFLLTSLDTATRLCRYQVEELSGGRINKWVATLITVGLAVALVVTPAHDAAGNRIAAWSAIWPVFGSANQLVAALSLLALAVWVKKGLKKNNLFLSLPYWFMLITTIAALVIMIRDNLFGATKNYLLGILPVILVVLAIALIITTATSTKKAEGEQVAHN